MTRSVAMGRHRDDPEADSRPPLEDRIAETRAALARLQERIGAGCAGPHVYVNHRDGKPPLCDVCGYSDVGLHQGEVNVGMGNVRMGRRG